MRTKYSKFFQKFKTSEAPRLNDTHFLYDKKGFTVVSGFLKNSSDRSPTKDEEWIYTDVIHGKYTYRFELPSQATEFVTEQITQSKITFPKLTALIAAIVAAAVAIAEFVAN